MCVSAQFPREKALGVWNHRIHSTWCLQSDIVTVCPQCPFSDISRGWTNPESKKKQKTKQKPKNPPKTPKPSQENPQNLKQQHQKKTLPKTKQKNTMKPKNLL